MCMVAGQDTKIYCRINAEFTSIFNASRVQSKLLRSVLIV